jgi:hypothetical protein
MISDPDNAAYDRSMREACANTPLRAVLTQLSEIEYLCV